MSNKKKVTKESVLEDFKSLNLEDQVEVFHEVQQVLISKANEKEKELQVLKSVAQKNNATS